MTTGSINYSPDYKSETDLPDNFGLMEIVCSDGQHRFLPDALRCGCLKTINPEAERTRLERLVIEAAKAEIVAADEYEKHLVMANWERSVETRQARQNAVRGLIDFESSQQQIKK